MKKIFITLLAITTAFGSVNAQVQRNKENTANDKPMHGEGRHEKMGKHRGELAQKLNLSEDQKTRLKSINESFKTRMQELQKNDGITVKDSREKRKALMEEHKNQVQAILTPEQKSQLETLKKDKKGKWDGEGKKGKMGKAPDMEKMKTELNLSADQVAKLKTRQDQMKEIMKSTREDQSLTKEQKKEKMQQLHKENKEIMEGILSPEQLQKMKTLKQDRKKPNTI